MNAHVMNRRWGRWVVLALAPLLVGGCAAGGRLAAPTPSTVPPVLVYCTDGSGHKAGAKPWILGGTCCCTPTAAMFAIHQAEQTVPADMTYEGYLKLYEARGILHGPEHAGCNNRCAAGPHVVLGGKCMAAPTPGTANYERVTQGLRTATL